jgi:hypothetical protein
LNNVEIGSEKAADAFFRFLPWNISSASRTNEKGLAMQISNFKDMYLAELQELVRVSKRSSPTRCCAWREQPRVPF